MGGFRLAGAGPRATPTLSNGSLRVVLGERVASGQVIAACGNSGRSTGPHLHYNLQAGPEASGAMGLPAQFIDYLANGERVARGEPLQGQTVQRRD
jgi:murein DD-endopeptidase MepM/ murein hydrolase activator NlpD